jgi:hypothetical protein
MINLLLTYLFPVSNAVKDPITKKVVPVRDISSNHNNYKKDSYQKNVEVYRYYGKKRRNIIDYC